MRRIKVEVAGKPRLGAAVLTGVGQLSELAIGRVLLRIHPFFEGIRSLVAVHKIGGLALVVVLLLLLGRVSALAVRLGAGRHLAAALLRLAAEAAARGGIRTRDRQQAAA